MKNDRETKSVGPRVSACAFATLLSGLTALAVTTGCYEGMSLSSKSAASTGDSTTPGTVVDVTSISYTGISFNVGAQDDNTHYVVFSTDGSKMYISGAQNNSVYQYNLSQSWNVSTAQYSGNSLLEGSGTPDSYSGGGIAFSQDGTILFVAEFEANQIQQFQLSTPWEISSATTSTTLDVSGTMVNPSGLALSADGTVLFVANGASSVYRFTLPTPFSLSGATAGGAMIDMPQGFDGICLASDNTSLFGASFGSGEIIQFSLGIFPDDQFPMVTSNTYSVSGQDNDPHAVYLSPDGTKMYVLGWANGQKVYEYSTN